MTPEERKIHASRPPPRFNRGLDVPSYPEPQPFRWRLWGGVLLAALVAGACYYHFSWRYHLPQERVLTLQDGKSLSVRIIGRAADVLQIENMGDEYMRYLPISYLSAKDQAFARKLAAKLKLNFPFRATLTSKDGEVWQALIQGRTDKYLACYRTGDTLQRYVPISSLSEADANWLQRLPANTVIRYPFTHQLHFARGDTVEARINGRAADLVRYNSSLDSAWHLAAIGSLAEADQAFLRDLPVTLTVFYPVEETLVTADGRSFQAQVDGRSDTHVRYVQRQDGTQRVSPMAAFSKETQDFLQLLPLNLESLFISEHTLTTKAGQSWSVRLDSRDDALVKFVLLSDNTTRYYPIAMLADADQAYVRRMPVGLQLHYPVEYTLSASDGESLNVRLLSLNAEKVRYQNLADGRALEMPVNLLAQVDQATLRFFPMGNDMPPPPAPVPRRPAEPPPAAPQTPKQIVHEAISALQSSSSSSNNGRSGIMLPSSPWGMLLRLTSKNDSARKDYMAFQQQSFTQLTIKNTLRDAIVKLQAIRTRENASTVDNLISSGNRVMGDIDAIAGSGNVVNKTAQDHIIEFIKIWEDVDSK